MKRPQTEITRRAPTHTESVLIEHAIQNEDFAYADLIVQSLRRPFVASTRGVIDPPAQLKEPFVVSSNGEVSMPLGTFVTSLVQLTHNAHIMLMNNPYEADDVRHELPTIYPNHYQNFMLPPHGELPNAA